MRTTSIIFPFTLFFLILFVSGTHAQVGFYETTIDNDNIIYSIEISNSDKPNYKYDIFDFEVWNIENDSTRNDSPRNTSTSITTFEEDIFRAKLNESKFFTTDSALRARLIDKFWNKIENKIERVKMEQTIAKLSKRDFIATIFLRENSTNLDLTITECSKRKGCKAKDSCLICQDQSKKFKPRKIDIAFENGIIKNIQTIGKIGNEESIFVATSLIYMRSKTDYVKLNTGGYYVLECKLDKKRNATFNLSDLLFFEIKKLYGSGTYIPADTTITINIPNDEETEIYGKSMNDNLDMRLYTDITGFDSESINGKFQFELKYNLYTRTYYLGNSWFLIDRISPFLNLSKIGESNDGINLNDSTFSAQNSNTDIPQFELLINSYVFSGIDMNLLKRNGSTVTYSLNLLVGIYRTTLITINSDTSKTDTTNSIVLPSKDPNYINSWFYGLNLDARIFENANLNMNFSMSLLRSGLFKPADGISPNPTFVFSVLVGMNYFPNEYNKTTALFFRTRFYSDINSGSNNLNFETGIYLPLTKFFSSFGI